MLCVLKNTHTFLGVRVKCAANFNPEKCAMSIRSLGNTALVPQVTKPPNLFL